MMTISRILSVLLLILCGTAVPAYVRASVSADDARDALERLDEALRRRELYIHARQRYIDSLRAQFEKSDAPGKIHEELAAAYTGFNNDSTLAVLMHTERTSAGSTRQRARMRLAAQLPLAGMFEQAERMLQAVDTADLDSADLILYYDCGRQMYSYLAAFFERYPDIQASYTSKAAEMQHRLLPLLAPDSDEYLMNSGEAALLAENLSRARVTLGELMERPDLSDRLRARAAHHLAMIAREDSDEATMIYYLAESAMADVRSATREVTSLQDLGATLSAHGDIDRAYNYLSLALTNAVECDADVRMLESARSLPYIEQAYARKAGGVRRIMLWGMVAFGVLALVLIGVLIVLLREMRQMRRLQNKLSDANRAKELSISQFLSLCSIYMDKLKQFSKLVARKISAGQTDELYRMARNGKLVEDESRDFYAVFDEAFLSIYPGFPSAVNALLRPEERMEMPGKGSLNTDLRILAFMRLGITDSASIARVLNYSVNTIYSYRNRLRARAINRDTFEQDVLQAE